MAVRLGYCGLDISLMIADFLFKSISKTFYQATAPSLLLFLSAKIKVRRFGPDTLDPLCHILVTQLPLLALEGFPEAGGEDLAEMALTEVIFEGEVGGGIGRVSAILHLLL